MSRPIVIAECCQNHNGSLDVLKRMIHEAAAAGADFVKIQSLRSKDLTFRERFEEGDRDRDGSIRVLKRPFKAEVERLSKLDLNPDQMAWFVDECRRAGVSSMITTFTRGAVREVESMGFDAIKIASYDCASPPLLRDVAARFARIVVSTGATLDEEIETAVTILAGREFSLLHCVTLYPTPLDALNFRRMEWLRRFAPSVGFSDHTLVSRDGLTAARIALALGADVVERHFTVLDASETKDGPVSIDPVGLAELVAFAAKPAEARLEIVRAQHPGWESSLGSPQRPLSPEEWLNRDYYRGRVATWIGDRQIDNWEDMDIDAVRANPT